MKHKVIWSIFSVILILPINLLALDGKHLGLTNDNIGGGAICIYCHTPHAANPGMSPLWNKGKSPTNFTMYGTTIAGTDTATQPLDESLSCLSCHDGVSAMNSVVNAPGRGAQVGFSVNTLLTDSVTYLLNPSLDDAKDVMESVATKAVGFDGLTNDHPISIEYIEDRGGLRATSTPLTDWIGASTIRDLLRGPNKDMVQCTSCHDPHNNFNSLYKRASMNGSKLCLGCHNK